jgi:hypothetical protein
MPGREFVDRDSAFLLKPFTPRTLGERVREILDTRKPR